MVKVRIAPSPTGEPHVGTAYSALFNWVFARRHGGTFVLRIEDTDRTRSTPESEVAIIESLRWLGLEWDEGPDKGGPSAPYRQSERSAIYQRHAAILMERKTAYPCFCQPERLAELRASKTTFGYDGRCRNLSPAEVAELMGANTPYVVRLKVDKNAATTFDDVIRGRIVFENKEVDDQVLLKSDGFPTYHLANVVDDHLMGITHVIRAEEWISSTPKHIMLYDAFGWEYPVFIHLPLLRNKNRSKISKRKNPTSILYYRERGYLPEALLNFLALMGWTTSDEQEVFDLDRMAAEFDPKDIHIGSPVFDLEKLDWLNGVYIRGLSADSLADRIMAGHLGDFQADRARILEVLPLVRERMKVLADFHEKADFFFKEPVFTVESFRMVKLPPAQTAALLKRAAALLIECGIHDRDMVDARMRGEAETCGVSVGQFFMAIRIAVTGKSATPPLMESMAVLGLEQCRTRIQRAIEALGG